MTTLPMWITVEVPMSKKEVEAYAGKPCPDFMEQCATCATWKSWRATGVVFVPFERKQLIDLAMKG